LQIVREIKVLAALTLVCATFTYGSGVKAEASGNRPFLDNHTYLEQQLVDRYGPLGYAQRAQGDSAVLAWNEAVVLDSYFQLYKSMGGVGYLSKMVEHIDYSLSNMSYYEPTGYSGWQTAEYSDPIPSGGSFDTPIFNFHSESGTDVPIMPEKWSIQSSSDPSKITINGQEADVVMEAVSGKTQKLIYYMTDYLPDTDYTLTLRMKTDGSGAGARLFVYDWGSTPASVMSDVYGVKMDVKKQNTDWQSVNLQFRTPSYVNKIGIVLQHIQPSIDGGKAYYDDIRLAAHLSPENQRVEAWALLQSADEQHVQSGAAYGYSGSGLNVRSDGLKVQGAKAYIRSYVPGSLYELSFYAKTDSLPAAGRVYLYDETTGEMVKDINGQDLDITIQGVDNWTHYEYKLYMPSSGHQLVAYIVNDLPGMAGSISVDEIQLLEVVEYLVHDASMFSPIAKLVKEIKGDSSVASAVYSGTTTYGDKANEYLPYLTDMVTKWNRYWKEIPGAMGVYVETRKNAGNALPHNQYLKMVNVLLPLYDITGNPDYLDKAQKMLLFFKSKLRLVDQHYYVWNYYDPAANNELPQLIRPEDVSHANLDLEAAVEGYRRGIVFTNQDMERFAATFSALVWNRDEQDPVVYRFLEPNPGHSYYYLKWPYITRALSYWANLAPWNSDIYGAMKVMFDTTATDGIPSRMAANAYLNDFYTSGVTVSAQQITMNTVTSSVYQLTAAIAPTGAPAYRLSWTSSNPGVVSVDQTGKLTAVSQGTAEIKVKTWYGRFEDTVLVIVE